MSLYSKSIAEIVSKKMKKANDPEPKPVKEKKPRKSRAKKAVAETSTEPETVVEYVEEEVESGPPIVCPTGGDLVVAEKKVVKPRAKKAKKVAKPRKSRAKAKLPTPPPSDTEMTLVEEPPVEEKKGKRKIGSTDKPAKKQKKATVPKVVKPPKWFVEYAKANAILEDKDPKDEQEVKTIAQTKWSDKGLQKKVETEREKHHSKMYSMMFKR